VAQSLRDAKIDLRAFLRTLQRVAGPPRKAAPRR
jgi:hypothetical protein